MLTAKKELFTRPSGGYQISRSVRLRASASAYVTRTFGNPTNNLKWTYSVWFKKGVMNSGTLFSNAGAGNGSVSNTFQYLLLDFNGSQGGQLEWRQVNSVGSITAERQPTMLLRDPSAWYHLVCVWDSANATAGNRMLMYLNGVQITSFTASVDPSSSLQSYINSNGYIHDIGASFLGGSRGGFFDGYLTEINFIDGQALTPSSFGETNAVTGVWQPKRYAGTYGTNGFYLNFSDNSGVTATTIGKDYSGNGNNWTPSAGISITAGVTYDSMLDVPTLYADGGNGRGNYAVLNPLDWVGAANTITAGNLDITTSSSVVSAALATMFVSSGKWYWEFTVGGVGGFCQIGIAKTPIGTISTNGPYQSANVYTYISVNGTKGNNNTTAAYGATYTTNDVIGVALDMDAGTLVFFKNNVSQGTAYSGLSGEFAPIIGDSGNVSTISANANFGQRPFTYTPPTGFVALNTQNLPTPTISNGATVMAATLYTGNGATGQSVVNTLNGVSFAPDFVWVKVKSAGATSHYLADTVRGATKYLQSDTTAAEGTNNGITAFNSNGFSVGAIGDTNSNTASIVGWQWNAGGSTVTNTSGSISAQVRANATAGFSVVTYTGTGANATVGHGLNATPAMIIVKNRDSGAIGGAVYHTSLGATKYLKLFQTTTGSDNEATDNTAWNGGSPTFNSSVFSVGSLNRTNSSQQMVAYCFAAVSGYSAFGKYTGNGVPDGPFVFLGFRPRWVMIKRTDSTGNWQIIDTSRSTYNEAVATLYPNLTNAEDLTNTKLDALSNGFKIRGTPATDFNVNGSTYVYACFAENPFKLSLAR